MATPRHKLVDQSAPCFYHLVSRCVRRSWLCGFDRHTRRNYEHRKNWLVDRLRQLSKAYAVELHGYAVMSNHFHLVVYYDPQASHGWSNDEVVDRWLMASPPRASGLVDQRALDAMRAALLKDEMRLKRIRNQLGSLSMFMKHVKQPIARRANLEDRCTGHFFEQRFYSAALLSDDAVLAAMCYVDLNPIRAKISESIKQSQFTSAADRMRLASDDSALLEAYLAPLVSGLADPSSRAPKVSLSEYLVNLDQLAGSLQPTKQRVIPDKIQQWQRRVALLGKRQRVYGPSKLINAWLAIRGMQPKEAPL